jgi:ubiquinone/menaquinone biosynthesis C-methylase UbiE
MLRGARAPARPRRAARTTAARTTAARTTAATPRALATTTTTTAELPQPPPPLVLGAVEALFRVKPLFDAATRKARATIIDRAAQIGVDWEAEKNALRESVGDGGSWDAAIERAVAEGTSAAGGRPGSSAISYPSYYTVPFHAYPEGNLSLTAALEVGVAAASVHATVFAPAPAGRDAPAPAPDPHGDARLRSGYMDACLYLLRELEAEGLLSFAVPPASGGSGSGSASAPTPLRIADFGAATGLSSLALAESFGSSAQVTGVDLSPHFVAVGRVEMARRRLAATALAAATAAPEQQQQQPLTPAPAHQRVALLHGAIEDTGLPSASFDVVSMCLVAHELPRAASRDAFREARRLLKPGGAFCMMDMDPLSAGFKRIYSNPFALAAFKSTEPWLTEYVALDAMGAVADAGFVGGSVRVKSCSPRHRAIVAAAPKA